MSNIINVARDYAITCHRETNHTYDDQPYSVHLQMAVDMADMFIDIINFQDRRNVIGGIWTHDVIEDCRQTFNDVKNATNIDIARLSYAVTNEKGKTRSERANSKYYKGIRKTKYATFVKLADRLANVEYSSSKGLDSKMFLNYKKENDKFVYQLIRPDNIFLKILFGLLRIFMTKNQYINFLIRRNPYKRMIYYLNSIINEPKKTIRIEKILK